VEHPPASGPFRIFRFDEVTSTNETVLAAGERGDPEWTVHIARRQTRGRGRGAHTWWSPEGRGLWMSVLLRPASPPSRLGGLALVTGVAVREALESLGARPVDVFWPNDLYHLGRKLGGILGEVRTRGAPPRAFAALGIGINIDLSGADVPAELRGAVATLAEAGAVEREPEGVALRILERLRPLYESYEDGVPLETIVSGRLAGIGRTVQVRVPPAPAWSGRTVGIGPEGELLVERRDGSVEKVRAAEVDYGRP
jgi:BirA family transcriptional regulator, biotin operon repressor / biotin---[acetyl-CoA-carboxylase] ligase